MCTTAFQTRRSVRLCSRFSSSHESTNNNSFRPRLSSAFQTVPASNCNRFWCSFDMTLRWSYPKKWKLRYIIPDLLGIHRFINKWIYIYEKIGNQSTPLLLHTHTPQSAYTCLYTFRVGSRSPMVPSSWLIFTFITSFSYPCRPWLKWLFFFFVHLISSRSIGSSCPFGHLFARSSDSLQVYYTYAVFFLLENQFGSLFYLNNQQIYCRRNRTNFRIKFLRILSERARLRFLFSLYSIIR